MKQRRKAGEATKRRTYVASAAVGLACSILLAGEARADGGEVSGTVISIDEKDIILDIGTSKGGEDGDVVELWRPFKLRHPVTGKMLIDRFRIGTLKLVQVQRTLAFARPQGELARAPAAGDVAILPGEMTTSAAGRVARDVARSAEPSERSTAIESTSDAKPVDEGDPEARELSAIFDGLHGQPPAARIARYERFAQAHRRSKYARVLYEEASYLRRLLVRPESDPGAAKPIVSRPVTRPPESALAATSLDVGVEASSSAGAVLHARPSGEMAYRSFPMRAAGAGYFRAAIPAERMKGPEVDFFVESVNAAGVAAPLVGSAEQPERIEVHDAPRPEPPRKTDASVALFTDYADYNRLKHNDYAWQTEGYFGLRYRDVGVRALRSGFGVYRGVGGSLEELDTLGLEGRHVGLTYGYLEGEYGVTSFTGLIGRLAIGLTNDGVDGGGQFFVRLGNDKVTNILLGGEVLGGIGLKGVAELQWNTIARVPIVIRTEVTNQPAGTGTSPSPGAGSPNAGVSLVRGDIGARAMVQVGYRFVQTLTLALRGSYEGRTIQHAGPGAGVGVTYQW